MSLSRPHLAIGAAALTVWQAASATAQCTTIDFDDLPVGTIITTDYDGVTISGRDTDGTSGVSPRIYSPSGTTSSEPQCLSAQGDGVDEFSPEFLRFDFDQDQTLVTFSLGVRTGCVASDVVTVRLYSLDSGVYTIRRSMSIPVNGTSPLEHALVFVRAERTTGAVFRRIEVEAAGACAERFELIDDLSFNIDNTPPIAEITTPAVYACQCNSSPVIGSAYDPDGGLDRWQLHRKAPDAASWVLIDSDTAGGEIIDGQLAIWTSSAPTGWYVLRLTVRNLCGLTTEAHQLVWLDKSFDSLSVRSPTTGAILGGTVCADGTVLDHCGGTFQVQHRSAGGAAVDFDSVSAPWVTNDPLGSWDTRVDTADGDYTIEVTASDDCANSAAAAAILVTIDNTRPTAVIDEPIECALVNGVVTIRGTASDANMAGWSVSYTGGHAADWVPIPGGSGGANVVDDVLAEWDTAGLRACAYTLRLVATDLAVLDCNGALHNQSEYVVSVEVGEPDCVGDLDDDGGVGLGDLTILLGRFGAICP